MQVSNWSNLLALTSPSIFSVRSPVRGGGCLGGSAAVHKWRTAGGSNSRPEVRPEPGRGLRIRLPAGQWTAGTNNEEHCDS